METLANIELELPEINTSIVEDISFALKAINVDYELAPVGKKIYVVHKNEHYNYVPYLRIENNNVYPICVVGYGTTEIKNILGGREYIVYNSSQWESILNEILN